MSRLARPPSVLGLPPTAGWLRALVLLLSACEPPYPRDPRGSGETGGAPEWTRPVPVLDGDELVPGFDASVWVEGVPPGASVVFYQSGEGLEPSECLGPAAGCSRVVAPIEYGTAVVDVYGMAKFVASVPNEALPGVVYFQALVTDPVTGASSWSLPIQRHVAIPPARSPVSLLDRTAGAGVGVFTYGNSHTGGVAWPDINGDLWPDLFVGNGGGMNHRLFRNDGDGTFTDVSTLVPKRSVQLEDAQPSFADIDGDGDVDLLVVVDSPFQMDSEIVQPREGGPNALYVNQGDGTFTEEAEARGLVDPRGWRNITGAFADFDGDGDVDVHLGTWAMNQPGQDRYGKLLLNDGTGHFTDSGARLGYGRDVLTALAADVDVDGFPELYLGDVNKITGFVGSNPAADDVLYHNVAGELVDATGSSPGIGDDAWAAMGLDVGDVDNDGDFDLYVADRWEVEDPLPRGNPYYRNDDTQFADNTCDALGICTGYASWPTQFADFDRDGWVDL
ncbi:MAG: VCBS repeat-containing protein, partial [Myxococcota bacterium]